MTVSESAQASAPAAHYQVNARISPGTGILHADVTVTLPPGDIPPGTSFLLGRRFKITSVDAGRRSHIQIENTDEPIKSVQAISVKFDEAPQKAVTLRFRYEGPLNDPEDE